MTFRGADYWILSEGSRQISDKQVGVMMVCYFPLDLSSIYTDALPLFQITRFCSQNLNGVIFPNMTFDLLA
jgi:hypothetical protein